MFCMGYFEQVLSTLREQVSSTLSRSDVLKPLAWLIGLELTALVLLTTTISRASPLLVNTVALVFVVTMMLYGFSYLYCLLKDRDALRSERYSLQKMAIEHSLLGDSGTGIIEGELASTSSLTSSDQSSKGDA